MSPVSSLHRHPHRTVWQGTNRKSSSSSPDPLLLSLSSGMNYADADDSRPIDLAAEPQMSSRTARPDQDDGAEPGPGASPNFSIRLPSPEFNSPQLSPSPDPFTVLDHQPLDVNPNGTLAIENGTGDAGGRYSMRTRQPRQLKPYAFDRLAYKQQLKHHPDAIVKLVGRRSPVESSSRSSEGITDDAAENSGGEHPSGDARTLPHIKGKKRHRAGEGHPSTPSVAHRRTSGVQLFSGSPLDRRFTGPHSITDLALVASIPDIDGGNSPVEAGAWYPDAFSDLSSGLGGDGMPLSTAQDDLRDSHTPPPRAKRRRRIVPRALPRLSPLASPSPHSSGPSSLLSRPALLGAISVNSSSDTSSSESESTQGSDDDVALLFESSAIMVVDDHSPSLSPKLERSPPRTLQKRRLKPSRYPVITSYFAREPSEKKKRPRKRGIVPSEKASRPKRTSGKVRTSDPRSADRRGFKTRPRRQHERSHRHADLSVFTVAGGRIMSGWQRRNAVTIDTEDIAFRRALEPSARRARQSPNRLLPSELPRTRRPSRQALRGPINRTGSSSTLRVTNPTPDEETRHRIVVDFDIPSLPLGKVYTASSYLGKGWLYELLSIASGTPPSHPPPAIEVDGHGLSSVSTALDYTIFLPYACDSFAKVLNDRMEMSFEEFTSWNATMHGVCSLVSWTLASAEGNDAHLIRTASLEYTGSLVARIDTVLEDSGDRARSPCSAILCLHWFAVELLVRACWSASDEDLLIAISSRVIGMANRLLQVGSLATVLRAVVNHESLDDFSLYPCVAELWICLVHLGTLRGRAPGAPGERAFPPIVEILQNCPAAAESSTQGGVKASEDIWCTLFGLCSLSQFSAHGVSTSSARMSTSWKLVLLALDHIRLVADPQADNGLSSRSLRRRDAYIRLIVSRCLILHQRWSWRLDLDDDASAVLFRRLVEIFKSRKFADLRGEIAGFAAFVQENDASLLVVPASTDSAFTIFLKLIYASAQQMKPSLRDDEYLGRAKKLLSLVTPVGSVQLQLSALRSPFDEQLSMLYNRFSSLALAIRILPSAENVLYRVSLARHYVDFVKAAAATRSVCIRAANFLALQALDMTLPISPALKWTSEIAQILIAEFRTAGIDGAVPKPPAKDARERRTELVQCIQLLLSGFNDMSRLTIKSMGEDPSTTLELLQKA
ncbi:Mus7/MMS22 family-domain-containing protein [Russula emetica]|nr:Mus7/MMS22 family-domain-containing protein [Russula emetica]